MNRYIKSFLKLADEALCEDFILKKQKSNTNDTLEDIKLVLKYRFGLDFDNDIKTIISECSNLRLDGYMYLPKLLKKMAEILDNNISAQHIYSSTLNIPIVYTDILKDVDKDKYFNNIAYYILCNMHLVILNLNDDRYHNYDDFSFYYDFTSNKADEESDDQAKNDKFNSNKLTTSGRQAYKDSFWHSFFSSDENVKKEESNDLLRKPHQWCEANDAVCISSVYNANYSPYADSENRNSDKYSSHRFCKFRNNYYNTLKLVQKHNDNNVMDHLNENEKNYNHKIGRYTKDDKVSIKHSSVYLSEMIYNFSMIKEISDVLKKHKSGSHNYNNYFDELVNDIFRACSKLIIIPDVLNRNVYAKKVSEYILNVYQNDIYLVNRTKIEELNRNLMDFSLYQSKVYYYLLMTYSFLTINHILKINNPNESVDNDTAERYIRRLISAGVASFKDVLLSKNSINSKDLCIDDYEVFYYFCGKYYNIESFDIYFSNNLFTVKGNISGAIEILFKYLKEDFDKEIGMLYGLEDHKIPFICK